MKALLTAVLVIITTYTAMGVTPIKNYVFFGMDRERITEQSFLETEEFVGAQLKYSWKELEPEEGKYNFSDIENDLEFLTANGKKLFIQLQDVTFDTARCFVPDYIQTGEKYSGGVAVQYMFNNKGKAIRQDGFVPRRWDAEVAERFYKLLDTLAHKFDGKIAGINLPETAVGFYEEEGKYPKGFTPEGYRNAILNYMRALRSAFNKSVVIQYANFMPGEWLPYDNKGYLESLYKLAVEKNIGMGGPDIKIYKKAQMNHSYKFLKEYTNSIITGVAVQWGNYEEVNPKTGKQVTIEEIYKFAEEEVELNFIFWCTQEPYYSKKLIPFLKKKFEE